MTSRAELVTRGCIGYPCRQYQSGAECSNDVSSGARFYGAARRRTRNNVHFSSVCFLGFSSVIMIARPYLSAWLFASAASVLPILILIYGVFGVHGNAIVTASYLVLSICGMACFGTTKGMQIGTADIPFLAFLACIGISFAVNLTVASPKGIIQLMITLAAFPAARLLGRDYIPLIRQACFSASALIVALGAVLTVPALVAIAGKIGRPLVFGFENAATAFSISLGLLVLTFVTSDPVWRSPKGRLTVALISIASMIFAASMVRFTLLAILAGLAICFVLSVRDRRLCLASAS